MSSKRRAGKAATTTSEGLAGDRSPSMPRATGLARLTAWLMSLKGAIVAIAGVGAVLGGFAGYWNAYQAARGSAQPHQSRQSVAPAPADVAASAPAGVAAQKTVAVLAFANLSDDKANEYFADGVSDELLNILSRVQGLRVTARNSAFYFKDKTVPMAELARQLGVTYLVDGSVRRAGERVRIAAQLVHAEDGAILWSQTFDREFKDVLAVQVELGLAIAKSLKLPLDAASLTGSGTDNVQAWQLFLQGERMPHGQREDFYHRALALDPNFAQAYLQLGREAFASAYQGRDRMDARARSVKYLNDALRIDPRSAEAYGRLASAESLVDDMDAVRRNAQRALQLDPNQIAAHHWMAELALEAGHMDEALAERRLMVDVDPLDLLPRLQYAELLLLANRATKALAVIDEALALYPNDSDCLDVKSAILLQLGRRNEALAIARRQDNVEILAQAGTREDLAALLRRTDLDVHQAAWVALARGQRDAFLDHLEMHVHELHFRGRALFDPALDPVRKLPRFKAWLEKCHLMAAHERAQAWRAANPAPRAGGI
jgi:adenylate cyclase